MEDIKNKKRKLWSADEDQIMHNKFPNSYTTVICDLLGRSYESVSGRAYTLGLKKSPEFREMELAKQAVRLQTEGVGYRFPKGRVPSNKGQKISKEMYAKLESTMFKKGQKPHNTKKIGDEVLRNHKGVGYWMIKLPDRPKLIYKHKWLWENAYGKTPRGFNIVFKDGNQLNCTIDNLECISNKELLSRNTIARFPEELIKTIRLVNKLNKKINAKQQN